MSNIIKTSDISHDEIVCLYEQRCAELKKEFAENVHLKAENKRLLERLKNKERNLNNVIKDLRIINNL